MNDLAPVIILLTEFKKCINKVHFLGPPEDSIQLHSLLVQVGHDNQGVLLCDMHHEFQSHVKVLITSHSFQPLL